MKHPIDEAVRNIAKRRAELGAQAQEAKEHGLLAVELSCTARAAGLLEAQEVLAKCMREFLEN